MIRKLVQMMVIRLALKTTVMPIGSQMLVMRRGLQMMVMRVGGKNNDNAERVKNVGDPQCLKKFGDGVRGYK